MTDNTNTNEEIPYTEEAFETPLVEEDEENNTFYLGAEAEAFAQDNKFASTFVNNTNDIVQKSEIKIGVKKVSEAMLNKLEIQEQAIQKAKEQGIDPPQIFSF